MNKKTLDKVDLKGKRVFIRADFNVPVEENGQITDDGRIRATLPTINYALDNGAKVILASHLGEPKGKPDQKFCMATVAIRLSRLLNKEVRYAKDCIGPNVEQMVQEMHPGDVILLENLRFHPEEERNDEGFSRALAAFTDIFVNDAFGTAHRAHASTYGITKFVQVSVAGFLMKKEINYLQKAVADPLRPFVLILGGAKVSGKISVIENLSDKVDKIIVGGAMAFTFIKARGQEVGSSLVEQDLLETAQRIRKKVRDKGVKFYLPVDFVVAENMNDRAETKIVTSQEIPKGWIGLDIGPATTHLFTEAIQNAKTIIWNGPMGMFEKDAYCRGTFAIARSIADVYATTIVGGGDTAVAIHRAGVSDSITFISTGGGAALELLEGKELPGLSALTDDKE
ncbi:MAG: phosphoglycerate kinase [Deltaproteobacteria bacterium RIFOXYD12_FULL_50_9]|nr:MAG: phosphoglycerate kinase [Deltaproteobacteria bacterium RIFOXYD12_FULL_50_9]